MPSLKNLNDFKQITEEKVKKDGYAPWQKATSQSVVSSDLVSAKPAFRYDDSDLGYVTTRDNENLYADYQSPLESFGKGITKFVGDVAIGIVGNLSAIPVGIGSAIVNGDATKLFDNDYTAALDAASESLSEALPFYYSSNYADKNLFQRMGTANFWWDKVLGGASFTVSAIASEAIAAALTGATFGAATPALVGTTARVISRANKIFKAADTAIDATKGAAKGFRMAEEAFQVGQAGIRAAGDVATTATAWNRIGTFARQQMFGTMYEASVEARHHANELREALIEEHRNRYGTDPTEQDMQDIEREVASSGTASFLSNVALLSASNMAMYKNFGYGVKDLIGKRLGMAKVGLAPGRGVAKGAIKEVEETVAKTAAQTAEKELAEGVVEGAAKEVGKDVTYKAAYDTWSGLRKGLDKTWTIAKQPLTEGLEEGMQSIISNTLKDYHMHKYNPESLHETASIVDSFGKALKQQYSFGNADAWEENFIGMFLGGVGLPTITTRYNAEGKQERGFGMAGGIFQEMKDRNIEIQRQRDHAEFLNKTKLDSVEVVKKTM